MNEIFKTDEFAIETVATSSFPDEDAGRHYQIEVAVIRMNHIALREWRDAKEDSWRNDFDTQEEWELYRAMKEAKMEAFEQKVRKALDWTDRDASFGLTRNVSEIFTAVRMWRVTG